MYVNLLLFTILATLACKAAGAFKSRDANSASGSLAVSLGASPTIDVAALIASETGTPLYLVDPGDLVGSDIYLGGVYIGWINDTSDAEIFIDFDRTNREARAEEAADGSEDANETKDEDDILSQLEGSSPSLFITATAEGLRKRETALELFNRWARARRLHHMRRARRLRRKLERKMRKIHNQAKIARFRHRIAHTINVTRPRHLVNSRPKPVPKKPTPPQNHPPTKPIPGNTPLPTGKDDCAWYDSHIGWCPVGGNLL